MVHRVIANNISSEKDEIAVAETEVDAPDNEHIPLMGVAAAAGNEAAGQSDDILFEIIENEDGTDTDTDIDADTNENEDFIKNLPQGSLETLFDPRLDLSNYKSPPLSLLEEFNDKVYEVSREELELNNKQDC